MVVHVIIIYKIDCLVNLAHMVIVAIIDSTENSVGHVYELMNTLKSSSCILFFILECQYKLEYHNI